VVEGVGRLHERALALELGLDSTNSPPLSAGDDISPEDRKSRLGFQRGANRHIDALKNRVDAVTLIHNRFRAGVDLTASVAGIVGTAVAVIALVVGR
jgi:hypothetical protein